MTFSAFFERVVYKTLMSDIGGTAPSNLMILFISRVLRSPFHTFLPLHLAETTPLIWTIALCPSNKSSSPPTPTKLSSSDCLILLYQMALLRRESFSIYIRLQIHHCSSLRFCVLFCFCFSFIEGWATVTVLGC